MKTIQLTQGKVALVDDEDYEFLNKFKWCATVNKAGNWYAVRYSNGISKPIKMHRFIMDAEGRWNLVDHKDRDSLNNQKNNLRFCTHSQNMRNRASQKNSSSKYLGVGWHIVRRRWVASIRINGKKTILGRFKDEKDAAVEYNKVALKYHGEFANLNIID